jgi:hypothetical protein
MMNRIHYFCKKQMRMRPILMVEGLRNLHDARYCAAVGISMASFDLGDESGLAPATLREILEWLSGLEGLGAFRNEDGATIVGKAQAAGVKRVILPLDFDWAQVGGMDGLGIVVDVAAMREGRAQAVNASTHWNEIEALAQRFPHALFLLGLEEKDDFPARLTSDPNSLLPRCILRFDNPNAIYRQLQQQGVNPYGFCLGAFAADEYGHLDYDACDAFIQQYQELEPA